MPSLLLASSTSAKGLLLLWAFKRKKVAKIPLDRRKIELQRKNVIID